MTAYRFLIFVVALAASTPVFAQETARDLLRQSMESRGFYSGVDYESRESEVASLGDGSAIIVSEAVASGGGTSTYLAVVRNTSSMPFCIRVNVVITPFSSVTGILPGISIVEPFQHLPVAAASGSTALNTGVGVAFWPTDPLEELSCSDLAPTGLESWASQPPTEHFEGSRFY